MDLFFFLILFLALNVMPKTFAEDFHPERTLLIDYYPHDAPKNFLFRGNMPISNGTFAYESLVNTLRAVTERRNITLPRSFSILDVSYLNIFEERDMKIERDFFKHNSSLGTFYNRVIVGTEVPPPQDDPTLIKDIIETYTTLSLDNLPSLMEYFHKTLTDIQNESVVMYSHCEAGTDRTGEVSGAYYMKYMNMTFTDALNVDNHLQNRDMYKSSRNAMQWYCFYLNFRKGMKWLNCSV